MKKIKYYKELQAELIRKSDLKEEFQMLIPEDYSAAMVYFHFEKDGHITFDLFRAKKFTEELFSSEPKTFLQKIKNIPYNLKHFLHYKMHIKRHANRKMMMTTLIKWVGIGMLCDENSDKYKEAKYKFEILYGLIDSSDAWNPIFIWDNIMFNDSIENYHSYLGHKEKAKEIYDLWMNSKHTDKDRVKVFNNRIEEVLKICEIKW